MLPTLWAAWALTQPQPGQPRGRGLQQPLRLPPVEMKLVRWHAGLKAASRVGYQLETSWSM